ncbi:MAG: helix-turn-helix transcriptional regulator [Candidatus Levybacteria bacterium]|nr:helix-turn-helix transcriptional regulator [Candidatus Levybacteria bacterium]
MNKMRIYTFREDLEKRLKDPEFKKAWEESEVEYQLAKKLIEARLTQKLSQRELAQKVKTSQAAISRIEAMHGNPSLSLLKRITKALDIKLHISLIRLRGNPRS